MVFQLANDMSVRTHLEMKCNEKKKYKKETAQVIMRQQLDPLPPDLTCSARYRGTTSEKPTTRTLGEVTCSYDIYNAHNIRRIILHVTRKIHLKRLKKFEDKVKII